MNYCEVILMGMTDKQFIIFLRELVSRLEDISEEVPDNKKLEDLLARYRRALED